MLSIGKLTGGRADYYVEQLPAGGDEYYLAGREAPACWLGAASGTLGLAGPVTPDAFRRLLDAAHPASGEPLGVPKSTRRRVPGFDLCFSAPKSVSVAWALGSPAVAAAVEAAHDRAVASAVAALEGEVVRARRGAGGQRLVETAGVAAAAFGHRSSRAGDPQLHTHVVVANLTPSADGRWSAIDSARVYRWAKTLGYLYQAELRHHLTATLGVGWGPVRNGTAEIAGIPAELTAAFSTRRAAITAALETAGGHSARAAQAATLATRAPKASVADLESLRGEWAHRAGTLGADRDLVAGLCHRPPAPAVDAGEVSGELLGDAGLTRQSSSFDRRDVLRALAAAHPAGAPVGELRAAATGLLEHPDVVALASTVPAGRRYTTRGLLEVEARLLDQAAATLPVPAVPAVVVETALGRRASLTGEQRRMATGLCSSDAAVQVVVGRAGTGKTFALDAARDAWARAGRPVIGAALAARAAAELQAGAGIPATTLDRLLADLDRPGPLAGLRPGTVVVVDEAGMVGTRRLAHLLERTRRSGAQLVLVGDPRQLPAIDAGGALAALVGRVPTFELVETRRQSQPWERAALAELRAGSVPAAVAAYHDHGRLTLAATAEAARDQLVADWWTARAAGTQAAMYALRRADVDDLNRRARLRLDAAGLLGPERIQVAGAEFAVGDQVLCLRNDRRLGVRNGTTGTLTALDADGLVLDGRTRLPAGYLAAGHLGHAYATTIHKAQGATVEQAFVLGSEGLYREAGYVGLSRARARTDLYLVADLGRGDGRDDGGVGELTRQLGASRAEQLALDQLPTPAAHHPPVRSFDPQRAAVLADPAPFMLTALGPPPLDGPGRDRWATAAARLAAYRDIYAVTGPDPLGPEPGTDPQRRAWALARLAIDEQARDRHLEQGLTR